MADPTSTSSGTPATPSGSSSSTSASASTTPLHQVLSNAQVNLQSALDALSGASSGELETLRSADFSLLRAADQTQQHNNNPSPPPSPPPDPPDGGGSGCGAHTLE
jgi:hypothetical protein